MGTSESDGALKALTDEIAALRREIAMLTGIVVLKSGVEQHRNDYPNLRLNPTGASSDMLIPYAIAWRPCAPIPCGVTQ